MGAFQKYMSSLVAESQGESLLLRTIRFLVEEDLIDNATLLAHHLRPEPFELMYTTESDFDLNLWKSNFRLSGQKPSFLKEFQLEKNNRFYLLNENFQTQTGHLLITSSELADPAREILRSWNTLHEQRMIIRQQVKRETEDRFSNYISQIIHDSQSLIQVCQDVKLSPELQARLKYQEDCNQKILFYIREPHLFKISVRPEHFISDSLDLIGIDAGDLNLEVSGDLPEISIDLELMSQALNEIVKNAISASGGTLSGITIRLEFREPETPLHDFNWMKMEIEDQGCGIVDDFISQSTRPFFTTRKNEGATGFGLSLASKIVETHQGCLEIRSKPGQGTNVTIYIPQDRK
jgi:signal transduction histidine kinase